MLVLIPDLQWIRPSLPDDITLSPPALDFMNEKCLAGEPGQRPTAKDLLKHTFITDVDASWTFKESKVGLMVAQRGAKTIRAELEHYE